MSESSDFHKKPLIIFELNEFNEDLLETAAKQHNLKNILALLSYPKTRIRPSIDNQHGTQSITPSERWETLHTGVKPSKHGIKHLGRQHTPIRPVPYWESLLANNHSVGIWGVMNAKKPKNPLAEFFLPDLWQSKEKAYPKILNNFISLPRYITKNFPSFAPDTLLRHIFKFFSFLKNSGTSKKIILEFIRLLYQLIHTAPRTLLFVCFYDLMSCLLFTKQLKKNPVHLSVFFANSLAYLQHYYWKQGKWVATPPLLHGLKVIDKMVGLLRQFEHTHHIILMNGLTQENRQYLPEQVIYKLKDPNQFFRYMALTPATVDPLSSHEGIVYFNSVTDCAHACRILNTATQAEQAIFSAKQLERHPLALHYNIVLNKAVTKEEFFALNGTEFRFFKYFKPVYTLTGSHDVLGTLYSRAIDFPKEILPENFSAYILDYYIQEKNAQSHQHGQVKVEYA